LAEYWLSPFSLYTLTRRFIRAILSLVKRRAAVDAPRVASE